MSKVLPDVTSEEFFTRLSRIMRRHVRAMRSTTDRELADACDLQESTIARIRRGDSQTSAPNAWAILAYIGPDAINEMLDLYGFAGAYAVDGDSACVYSAGADAADFSGSVHKAMADGVLDHKERAELADKARQTGERLIEIANHPKFKRPA